MADRHGADWRTYQSTYYYNDGQGLVTRYIVCTLYFPLTHACLKAPIEIIAWICHTFGKNFEIKNDITIYFKKSFW